MGPSVNAPGLPGSFLDILTVITWRQCFNPKELSELGISYIFAVWWEGMQDSLNHRARWLSVLFNQRRTHWLPWMLDSLTPCAPFPTAQCLLLLLRTFSISLAFIYRVYIYISKPLSVLFNGGAQTIHYYDQFCSSWSKMECFLSCEMLSLAMPTSISYQLFRKKEAVYY